MRLGGHKPGALTLFVDTSRDEVLLRIEVDASGCSLVSFTLYDANGSLVAEEPESKSYPDGITVKSADDELLLELPAAPEGNILYRLYNHDGKLLTSSDGKRTQIFGHLRMDGKSVGPWRPKAPSSETRAVDVEMADAAAAAGPPAPLADVPAS